jgi:hypothetical protein
VANLEDDRILLAKGITYGVLLFIVIFAFISANLKLYAELDALILFLIAYTLFLVMPLTDFDLGPLGFKGRILNHELNELSKVESTSIHFKKEAQKEKVVKDTKEEIQTSPIVSQDYLSTFLELMGQIQKTLDEIAVASAVPIKTYSLGELVRQLTVRGILKDDWLLQSLFFLRDRRNDILHLRKKEDITLRAIMVEKTVLTKLLEIKATLS